MGLPVLTNSTKILNITKRAYTVVCWAGEASEDLSNISFILVDMAIFGQPIPLGNIWDNITDFSLD